MDDDDLNMLAGIQRSGNLQQNEATRQSIEGLREDLRRKERAEAAAPKCPYCFGAISYDAVKCRHCASDIQCVKVQGRAYVLKAEDNAELFVQQKMHELAEEKQNRAAQEVRRQAGLTKCGCCGAEVIESVAKERRGRCWSCYKRQQATLTAIYWGLGIILCIWLAKVLGTFE